jgi:urease accessory protein UreF
MRPQLQSAPVVVGELTGDLRPLLEQIGGPDGLFSLAASLEDLTDAPILSAAMLRRFLLQYRDRVLRPIELPAIRRAFNHASRREIRELVAFDQELCGEPLLKGLASASRRVGQFQLQRLRPLRDDRSVQRYLTAVDSGTAIGWHTLVYGLTLAVYSVPLRQGLMGYAEQTTRGFIQSAAASLALPKPACGALFDEVFAGVPQSIEALLIPAALV